MDFSRLLSGNTPLIENLPVYKAGTAIDQGSILCITTNTASLQGATLSVATTTAANAGAIGVTMVSSSVASGNPENNALGSIRFGIGTDGLADATTAVGMNYLPLLVSPGAIYYASYSKTTGATSTGDAINVGITASTGTSVVLGSQGVDHAGSWLFTSATSNTAGGVPTYSGSLRYVTTTAASDTFGLATALNVGSDGTMLVVGQVGRKLTSINSGGNFLRSGNCGTVGKLNQNLYIHENWIRHRSSGGREALRFGVHNGLDNLLDVTLWSEVVLCASAYVQDAE